MHRYRDRPRVQSRVEICLIGVFRLCLIIHPQLRTRDKDDNRPHNCSKYPDFSVIVASGRVRARAQVVFLGPFQGDRGQNMILSHLTSNLGPTHLHPRANSILVEMETSDNEECDQNTNRPNSYDALFSHHLPQKPRSHFDIGSCLMIE